MLEKTEICPYPVRFLQNTLGCIKTGDLIMIVAGTGGGKSTISRAFVRTALNNNCSVVLYSLEDERGTAETDAVYQLAVQDGLEMSFIDFAVDNTSNPDKYTKYKEEVVKMLFKDNDKGEQMFLTHEQEVGYKWTVQNVLEHMKEEVEKGYRLFILDHIDVLVGERPEDMVKAMTDLWDFVAENRIALITFSQLAKGRNKDSLCPGLGDIRGSSGKEYKPTVIISLARHNFGLYQCIEEPRAYPTYMRILKNRFGTPSAAVTYFYKGNYMNEYKKVFCNDTGTQIDLMTMTEMVKKQKRNSEAK